MPCHRRKARLLEKEYEKSEKEIFRRNEKKAKVVFVPSRKTRVKLLTNPQSYSMLLPSKGDLHIIREPPIIRL
jgi:hypothetical protein